MIQSMLLTRLPRHGVPRDDDFAVCIWNVMYKELSSQKLITSQIAQLDFDRHSHTIVLNGVWNWVSISEAQLMRDLDKIQAGVAVMLNGDAIAVVDTCGIYFIDKIIKYLEHKQIALRGMHFSQIEDKLFNLIQSKLVASKEVIAELPQLNLIAKIGHELMSVNARIVQFIAFFGQFCIHLLQLLKAPIYLKWGEVSRTLHDAGLKGVLVSALLSFLLGVTLAYEMSPQFLTYGANVYIVNFLGIALLKEVAPLLTAVIVAGRTGASITAEIGTQMIQEEIDALKTMGISPIKRIVLPKVIGVMLALPLITALADIAAMGGGAMVAKPMLGISYSLFINRMQESVALSNYSSGIIKSVAFGLLIALVGCFCGFNVKGDANSIGEQTTKSVVLGIVAVVCCDALFAIIFNVLKM